MAQGCPLKALIKRVEGLKNKGDAGVFLQYA